MGDGRSFFTILYNYYFTNEVSKKSVANGGRYSKTFHLFYLVK